MGRDLFYSDKLCPGQGFADRTFQSFHGDIRNSRADRTGFCTGIDHVKETGLGDHIPPADHLDYRITELVIVDLFPGRVVNGPLP